MVFLLIVVLVACAPAPDSSAPAGQSEPWPPPSTVAMTGRIDEILDSQDPLRILFRNQERVDWYGALASPVAAAARAEHELTLAREYLRAGDSSAAITILETMAQPGFEGMPDVARRARALLPIAHLRAGEQTNCLLAHTAASCIWPIESEGVHRDPTGSAAAFEGLLQLLEEDPGDLSSRWLLNVAAMTLGTYPDRVPPEWRVPLGSAGQATNLPTFHDAAMSAGLATVGLAGSVAAEDFDGDTRTDVLVSSWGARDPLQLMVNQGDGRFLDESERAGLASLPGGLNFQVADYDNDGDIDVFVLRGAWLGVSGHLPNSLLRNDGTGRFEDVTVEAGVLSFNPTQTAAWGDYDADGWLDLFVGNESFASDRNPCELFHNNGDGTFTEVGGREGVAIQGYVKGSTWGDVDNDGLPDLYLSRLYGDNILLRNLGDGISPRFVEVTSSAGVASPGSGFPTWFWDYDNDGDLDLMALSYPEDYGAASPVPFIEELVGGAATAYSPTLYRNRGDGVFDDVSHDFGLSKNVLAMGANYGDLDNDGWLDFYVGTGAPSFAAIIPNRMFRNLQGAGFEEVTASGFGHLQKGHGIGFVDLDEDGDQDVYAVFGGAFSGDVYANALFENPGNDNGWVTLRLVGTRANRSAIGSRVRILATTPRGPREIHRVVGTGGSFGNNSLQLEVGLGDAIAIERVEVRWPGDRDPQVFHGVPMRRFVELEQDVDFVREIETSPVRFGGRGLAGEAHRESPVR